MLILLCKRGLWQNGRLEVGISFVYYSIIYMLNFIDLALITLENQEFKQS